MLYPGYKVKAFDYLVKPLSYLQLENVLDQAISELKSNEKHFFNHKRFRKYFQNQNFLKLYT